MKTHKQVRITILPAEIKISAREGDSLYTLLLVNHVLHEGQDEVRLEKGSVSPATDAGREEAHFSPTELADGWMLSSERHVTGDAVLFVLQPGEHIPEAAEHTEPADSGNLAGGLGLVVDLGSGTVAAGLADLCGKAIPAVSARPNSQCDALGDLGRRLKYMREQEGGLITLQKLLYEDIEYLTLHLADKTGLDPAEIKQVVVAANTTMGQMLWGETPGGPAGWEAEWRNPHVKQALDTPLFSLMPQAEIVLMPAAAADIGSDIVAALLASGFPQKIEDDKLTLLVDIGLSTEIVAAGYGRLLAASVGTPALEGVSIACGMRATVGAIVQVSINNTVCLRTVRDARPRGISGAGLISAAHALWQNGLLDTDGRIVFHNELPPRLAAHFTRGLSGGDFLLSHTDDGLNILIEQNDIRQLQLAKGGVYAACMAILSELGADERDIEQVLIGESFGAHIDPVAALQLGLLPELPPQKIKNLGNAAWQGAFLCLGNRALLDEAARLAQAIERLDLSANTIYAAEFLPAMEFKEAEY